MKSIYTITQANMKINGILCVKAHAPVIKVSVMVRVIILRFQLRQTHSKQRIV